jgi:hypothetical protein
MSKIDQHQSFDDARAGLPDVSPDESVIWKPLHRLLAEGNPIDPVTVLCCEMGDGKRLPFATIAMTGGNRLLLWPPSDARSPGEFADGETFPIHHITLELSNSRTHFTRFEGTTARAHKSHGWKLWAANAGLKMWLISAVRLAQLDRQAGALEMGISMPPSDSQRRIEEYKRYFAEMKLTDVKAPRPRGDYLITAIYLPTDVVPGAPIDPACFPVGSFWKEWIAGWPEGDAFEIIPTGINLSGVKLLLLSAAPPGRLKSNCYVASAACRRK